jgi:hypothetical protein
MYRDEPPGTQLGDNLRRMFLERGLDFFNQDEEQRRINEPPDEHAAEPQSGDNESLDGQNAEAQLQYASLTPSIVKLLLKAL